MTKCNTCGAELIANKRGVMYCPACVRDELEDMCYQFAYDGQDGRGPYFTTGGLSALEGAFDALGWKDKHYTPELTCEVKGCHNRIGGNGGPRVPWGKHLGALGPDDYYARTCNACADKIEAGEITDGRLPKC